jgi:hypothetical protein
MKMLNGNCTGDANPDWWFPEVPIGRSNPENIKRVASQINYALQLCATCPVKEACLEEGMKMEKMPSGKTGWGNLPFGIWGGTMGAERLASVNIKPSNSRSSASYQAYKLYSLTKDLIRR